MSRLLVVDDDAANRAYLATLGAALGIEVLEAENEAAAVAYARQAELAAVDLHLPGCDTGALVRRLKAARPALVVGLYTATPRSELVDDFMRLHGMTFFIPKPCEPKAVLEVLREALEEVAQR